MPTLYDVPEVKPTLYNVPEVTPMAVSTIHAGTIMERKMNIGLAEDDGGGGGFLRAEPRQGRQGGKLDDGEGGGLEGGAPAGRAGQAGHVAWTGWAEVQPQMALRHGRKALSTPLHA